MDEAGQRLVTGSALLFSDCLFRAVGRVRVSIRDQAKGSKGQRWGSGLGQNEGSGSSALWPNWHQSCDVMAVAGRTVEAPHRCPRMTVPAPLTKT